MVVVKLISPPLDSDLCGNGSLYLIRGLVNISLDHLCRFFCIAFAYADIILYRRPICVFCSVAVFLLANIRDSYNKLWWCISAVVSGDFDSLLLDRLCLYSGAYW